MASAGEKVAAAAVLRRWSGRRPSVRVVTALLFGTALSSALPSLAQVAPGGPDAPRMDVAANGTKIVTINRPSQGGVSNNTYTDFNVGPGGLILNNSPRIVGTALAGYVDGNANLRQTGPARVILNQVVSTNRSTLAGYLEVAGSPAQVIVANANGITCGGCGFINAPFVTLTTGAPRLGADGAVAGFEVTRGTILIDGQGLDASGARLDLFARAVQLNAGLWADRVNLVAGAGSVTPGAGDGDVVVTALPANGAEAAPRFALDVAALGGMYAGSIRLIGSEAGLGVRVDGTLASLERGFTLDANGTVQIGGRVIAATTADVRTSSDLTVGGTVYGVGPVAVAANGTLTNTGLIASGGNLAVTAAALATTGTLAAGLNRDGTSAAAGDMSLTARGSATLAGQIIAPGTLGVRAGGIDLTGTAQAGAASIAADRIGVAGAGQLVATGQATLSGGALTNAGVVQGGVVTANLASLTNNGLVASLGAMTLATSGQLANTGTVQAAGAAQITAGTIANAGGTILASGPGALTLTTAGALASRGGTVAGNGDVEVTARTIDFSGVGALAKPGQAGGNGQLSAGGTLRATATGGDLVADNGGLVAAGKDLNLAAAGTVHATSGTISAGGAASLTGAAVVLDGGTFQSDHYLINAGSVSLRRTQLIQTGTADQLLRTAGTLDYSGAIFTTNATNFAVQAGRIVNAGGELRHAGSGVLSLDAPVIDNHGGLIATAGTLRVNAGSLDNAGGLISAASDAALLATASLGNAKGVVVAGKTLTLTAGTVDNSAGDIESTETLVARLGSLTGAGGQLKATGAGSALDLRGDTLEARGGLIGSNGAVTLASRSADLSGATLVGTSIVAGVSGGDLSARGGIIQAGSGTGASFRPGSVTLSATGTIDVSAGGAIAGDAVKLTAARLDTSSGSLSAGRLDATLGALANRGGTIVLTQTAPLALTLTGALDNGGGTIATNASALTVQAASIANDGGRIAQAGTGLLTLSAGAIGNAGGTIASGGAYRVTAASFANAGGRLTGPGAGRLDVTGAVSNGGGLIAADAGLMLGTGALVNGGTIGSSGGALSLTAVSLANGIGLIQAGGVTLTVRDGTTNAVGGTIGSTGALSIAAGSLSNAGNVHADTDATLNLGELANLGQVSVGRQLSVAAGQLDNSGSLLGIGVTLAASGLGNAGGLVSGDAVRVTVAGLLDNGTGQIGGRVLTLAAGSMVNAGLLSAAGGAASDLDLTVTDALANRAGGAIWADRDLVVTAGSITNAGSIAGARDAGLTAGLIDNSAATGMLGAGSRLRLDFADATLGRLALGGDLAINARGDWTIAAGQVIAGPRDVAITVAGAFANNGALGANRSLSVGATAIDNRAGARIAGDQLALTAAGTLVNAGLINAGRSGVLTAGALDNRGQVFGDALTVTSAGPVGNAGTAAVIATRGGRLALFTPGDVANTDGALIHSAGTLVIAAHEDTGSGYGRAGSILNGSATIEAAGAGLLAADTLTNTRTTFTFGRAVQSATYVSLPPIYSDSDHRTSERYTRTISDAAVIADSGAGRILFGGDLRIDAGTLANRWSTLSAAGNLRIDAGSLSNVALAATEFDDQAGVFYKEHYICVSRFIVCLDHDWRDNGTDPLNRAYRTELGTLTPSVIAAGGMLSINAGTLDNLLLDVDGNLVTAAGMLAGGTATGPGSAGATGFSGDAGAASIGRAAVNGGVQVVLATTGGAAPVGTVANGGLVVGVTVGGRAAAGVAPLGSAAGLTAVAGVPARSAAAFQIGLGGLFGFASAPGRSYLIETNTAFTNGAQFLSSDYFLNRLGYDPARVEQRLGDAYYEQELVGRQLAQLTGTTRLAGYGDNESQYRALLDAGVRYAKAFDLGIGVGLTAAQMASLTGDLVLLVDVVVQTPTGPQHALAPVVYVANVRNADLASSGALIASGGALAVRTAGDLTNSGMIRGGTTASVAAGGTLINGGVLASTGPLAVSAGGDLVSRAGRFSGSDVTLAAGGNVLLGSTATATRAVTVDGRSATAVDSLVNQVTRIDAADRLTVIARGNLVSTGAQLTAGDTASVLVGGTASLGAVNDRTQTVDWGPVRHGATSTTTVDETAVGTGINAANGVTIAAGLSDPAGRLNIAGGSVASDGRIALSATGGVDIGAATEHDSAATATFTRRSGFLSTTRTASTDTITRDEAVGSTVSGGSVDLASSAGAVAITGSTVVADRDVTIAAAGPVSIGAAQTTESEVQTSSYKKSGLSLSGDGLFLGVAKTSSRSTSDGVTNVGSLIGSTGGTVSITSDDRLSVTGSTIAAPGTVALTGRSVDIANATDTLDTTSSTRSSSFGLTIGGSSPLTDGARTLERMGSIAGSTGNARVAAVAGLAGGLSAKNTLDAIGRDPGALGGATASISLGFSSSRSQGETHDETAVASQITGGDVALVARGAGVGSTIAVTGSDVRATGDPAAGQGNLTLAATGPITLAAAQERSTQSGSSRSSGASIGVSVGVGTPGRPGIGSNGLGAPSINLGFNNGSASYAGAATTNREANLSATGTARVATPDTLTLDGATLAGNRVEVSAGNLAIVSRQDTSTYTERNRSTGLQLSYQIGGAVSGAANFGSGRGDGSFRSVAEQAGIHAGAGGYGIDVTGATSLTGAAIASSADPSLNRLTTGTLSVADLQNSESWRASQSSFGIGLGNIGQSRTGQGTTNGSGTPLPGLATPVGTLTATPPVALSASGGQSSTTRSAIAPGTIAITSGDATSLAAAANVSRDTAGANAPLTQAYTDAKRAEIAQGFEAARQLTGEVATFFANRGSDEQALRKQAAALPEGSERDALLRRADALQTNYGAGSAIRLVATALSGVAGGNVTGSLGGLVQASAVSVSQGLATQQVKQIADSFTGTSTERETLRTALQAVVGCAGAAASGSACGSGATGAAASVVVNNVLTSLLRDDPAATIGGQEARTSVVASLASLLAGTLGGDGRTAAYAATIESQNNYLTHGQLLTRQSELTACGADQACVSRVNTRYADLSAYQDLQVAIACIGSGLPVCASLRDQQSDYLTGRALAATGLNSVFGGSGSHWYGSGAVRLDDFLRIDVLRSSRQSALDAIAAGDIVVVGATRWMTRNGITDARYGSATLAPGSTEAQLYALLPELYRRDQATAADTFLGRATAGQRAIAAGQFQGELSTITAIAAAEATIPCTLSVVCSAGLTAVAAYDCAHNPGLLNCGTAAIGVAVPAVRGVRAASAAADAGIAEAFGGETVFGANGRLADEAAGYQGVRTIADNQIAGGRFERQVIEALGFVGAQKNTSVATVTLRNGTVVNTIFDGAGRNVGGFLEIKNVQELNYTEQLQAQVALARSSGTPLNIVVSPTTRRVTQALQQDVRATGGNVFVFDPASGAITRFRGR